MIGNGLPSRPVNPSGNTHRGAVALLQQPPLVELVDDAGKAVVVGRLADVVLRRQRDVERVVDRLEVLGGLVDEQLPQDACLGVPALQEHHPSPGPVGEAYVAVELAPRRLVELGEVTERETVGGRVGAGVDEVLDEHAERGAPVAQVVLPDDAHGRGTPAAARARRR